MDSVTPIGALAMAVIALAGVVTTLVRQQKTRTNMNELVEGLKKASLPRQSMPIHEHPEITSELANLRDDVKLVQSDVKSILWHMVNGAKPPRGDDA